MTVKTTTKAAIAAGALIASATAASATSGYFALGYGTAQRSLGGAGVAHAFEAMSAAVNPAAAARVGNQFQLGAEIFAPTRGYTGTGTGFVAPGSFTSDNDYFIVPNFGYNRVLDNGNALNLTVYGNGGMNTDFAAMTNTSPGCGGGTGVFCGGKTGVDLTQLFVSLTYAGTVGRVSWGISPTLVAQRFGAQGLGAFAGLSANPAALSNTGYDYSYGISLKAGIIVDVTDTFRFGLSGQTKTNMSEFSKYSGLFAGGGDFDIPASITAGVAWDASPALTFLADYQKIYYSGVASISNPFPNGLTVLGAGNGHGFGWTDVDVLKLGVEYKASDKLILRAGYAHATNPIGSNDVTFNILAPGVVEDHFTFGGTYAISDRDSFDFGVVYTPEVSVSGAEVTPLGVTPGSNIEISMHQYELSFGWTRKF